MTKTEHTSGSWMSREEFVQFVTPLLNQMAVGSTLTTIIRVSPSGEFFVSAVMQPSEGT